MTTTYNIKAAVKQSASKLIGKLGWGNDADDDLVDGPTLTECNTGNAKKTKDDGDDLER